MSNFVPHAIAGIITGTLISGVAIVTQPNTSLFYNVLPLYASFCGALTPDMDIKSKSSIIMYLQYTLLALYFYFIGRIDLGFYVLLYAIIPQFFKHRGFIHSILFALISSGILLYILVNNGFELYNALFIIGGYFVGFCSHLVLDQ